MLVHLAVPQFSSPTAATISLPHTPVSSQESMRRPLLAHQVSGGPSFYLSWAPTAETQELAPTGFPLPCNQGAGGKGLGSIAGRSLKFCLLSPWPGT